MDTQGGTVARGEAIADGVSLLVPANGLRQGLYLLALRSRDGVHHAIKFIR